MVQIRSINTAMALLFILVGLSCGNKSNSVEISIDSVALATVPPIISLSEKKGVDSYIFELTNKKKIFLKGEYGKYQNASLSPLILVIDEKYKDSMLQRIGLSFDSSIVFFSKHVEQDKRENVFSKNFYRYIWVNGVRGKLIQPKIVGNGITGIVFDENKEGNKLTIFGENLSKEDQETAIQIFLSIKFL